MKIIFEARSDTRTNYGVVMCRRKAQRFILCADNVSGIGLYGDVMRVYRPGKTLYIDFPSMEEAGRAMDEITEAMTEDKPTVAVSCKPLNITDE